MLPMGPTLRALAGLQADKWFHFKGHHWRVLSGRIGTLMYAFQEKSTIVSVTVAAITRKSHNFRHPSHCKSI